MNGFISGTKQWFNTVMQPFGLMKKNFGNVIAFEVNFRLFTFFVLFPILTWAERLWLVTSKTDVIAWYNIGTFIKNPFTWIVLIIMIALLVGATMYEQFALYDALHASRFGMKRSLRQIISAGFDMCAERMKAENGELYIKTITVDCAPMLKRLRPAPKGRGYRIRKRSNHVTLFVDSKNNDK